jgi:hypothetical protein
MGCAAENSVVFEALCGVTVYKCRFINSLLAVAGAVSAHSERRRSAGGQGNIQGIYLFML